MGKIIFYLLLAGLIAFIWVPIVNNPDFWLMVERGLEPTLVYWGIK